MHSLTRWFRSLGELIMPQRIRQSQSQVTKWFSNQGPVNSWTSVPGGYSATVLASPVSVTFPAVNGQKYLIEISANYVQSNVGSTECGLSATTTGGTAIASATAVTYNQPMDRSARNLYTATSTGNITIQARLVSSSAASVRTDAVLVTVEQINT